MRRTTTQRRGDDLRVCARRSHLMRQALCVPVVVGRAWHVCSPYPRGSTRLGLAKAASALRRGKKLFHRLRQSWEFSTVNDYDISKRLATVGPPRQSLKGETGPPGGAGLARGLKRS
ncbi:unnamed protein product [Lota lota]